MNLISSEEDVLFEFRAQLLEKKIIEIKKVQIKQRKIKLSEKRNAASAYVNQFA